MKVISLFEDRMLTDLEAEINFVDFHIRGKALAAHRLYQLKSPDVHSVSGLNYLECERRVLLS